VLGKLQHQSYGELLLGIAGLGLHLKLHGARVLRSVRNE
jgi:hypothetical protein